jgi:hypothetical protein
MVGPKECRAAAERCRKAIPHAETPEIASELRYLAKQYDQLADLLDTPAQAHFEPSSAIH